MNIEIFATITDNFKLTVFESNLIAFSEHLPGFPDIKLAVSDTTWY
ncbi:hypothetical protein QUA79_26800 [Microcoleus sp. F8-D1]